MIAADLENVYAGSRYIKWPKLLQSETVFTRDFLLVWDWESSLGNEALIQTNIWESERSKIEFHLEKATRTWNVSLILGDLEEYQKAEEGLREAIEGYKIAFGEEFGEESAFGVSLRHLVDKILVLMGRKEHLS